MANTFSMKISKRIKSIREKSGLSTNKFAELLNISQPAFSRLENGKSLPRAETLIALYEKFQVDPLWLLTGQTRARIADPEALQLAEKFQRLPPESRRRIEDMVERELLLASVLEEHRQKKASSE